ncbi:hypothetical protein Tco_0842209 [Tanacetum coccineum]|uniref:Uncharacterized protein n=1 Tax=Tanacetum coccineum TaxID=301880 RepID=A0ABQ5B1B8_9ASTR
MVEFADNFINDVLDKAIRSCDPVNRPVETVSILGTDERAAIKSFTNENEQLLRALHFAKFLYIDIANKVMQADQDIIWLQCDFGLTVLKLERNSLECLLQYYCEVAANKEYISKRGLATSIVNRPGLIVTKSISNSNIQALNLLIKGTSCSYLKRLDNDTFKPVARFTCTSTGGRNVLEKECQKAKILHTGLLDKGMLEDGATDVDRVLGVIYGDIAFV